MSELPTPQKSAKSTQTPYEQVAKLLVSCIEGKITPADTQAKLDQYYRKAVAGIAKAYMDDKAPVAEYLEKFLDANTQAGLLNPEAYQVLKSNFDEIHKVLIESQTPPSAVTKPEASQGRTI